MDDRSTFVKINGTDYELLMTVKATKEIAKRYNGLDNLKDNLLNPENVDDALDEILWLIMVLANQSILISNLTNKQNAQPLLTIDYLELLTSPAELIDFKLSIMEAINKGMARSIDSEPSEDDVKNV